MNGKFVGGVDIVTELIENEEFDDMVPKECKKLSPREEWNSLIKQYRVVALIEGSVEQPLHMGSMEFVNILKENGVKYVAVDV